MGGPPPTSPHAQIPHPSCRPRARDLSMNAARTGATWEERYSELQRFREEHGHADVPLVSKTTGTVDPLGAWVKRQRRSYREGKLAPERRDSLQLIDGFAWVGKSCRAQGSSSGKEARRIQTELHD